MISTYKNFFKAFILATPLLISSSIYSIPVIATTNVTYADTIVSKVVSEIYNIPILPVGKNYVNLSLFKDANASEVIIIGGPAVVSPKVEDILKQYYNVTRLWGVTRYETSATVAQYFWNNSTYAVLVTSELTNEHNANINKLILVSNAVQDAINHKAPLLITPADTLDVNVANALVALGVKNITIYTISNDTHNLTDILKSLNISVNIVKGTPKMNDNNATLRCKNPIKIAVYPNLSWKYLDIALYSRCIEILPLNESENADIVIKTPEDAKMLKHRILSILKENIRDVRPKINLQQLKRIMEKKKMEIVYEKLNMLRNIIQSPSPELMENKSMLNKFEEVYNRCYKLMNNSQYNKFNESVEKEIDYCYRYLLEFKWKFRLYLLEEKIFKRIPKEYRFEFIRQYKHQIEEMYNESHYYVHGRNHEKEHMNEHNICKYCNEHNNNQTNIVQWNNEEEREMKNNSIDIRK